MEWIADPTAWLGLLTLIVLELVLGIDNLVFIAILADKLPPEQRDRARVIGLRRRKISAFSAPVRRRKRHRNQMIDVIL